MTPEKTSLRRGIPSVKDLLSRTPDWAILLFFFGTILLEAIPSLMRESATFDEVVRQYPGYLHLTAAEYRVHTDHPPLIKMLTALPLLFIDVRSPPLPERWTDTGLARLSTLFLYRLNDADCLVLLGRLAVLPLMLILGFFIFRWAKRVGGRGAAAFALFLYSFEPNILAHGRLMNTDVGIACFSFLTIYFFSRLLEEIKLPNLLLTGLLLGLALVTKYSALWIIPMLFLLGMIAVFRRRPLAAQQIMGFHPVNVITKGSKLLLILAALLVIGLISYLVIWGVYRFRYEGGVERGYAYTLPWEEVLPKQLLARSAILQARETRLLPDAYLHGLSLVSHKIQRLSYLNGEISTGGWWYYFIVTFLLKTPLPLILLLLLTPFGLKSIWQKASLQMLCLLLPPVSYFALAVLSRFNIGHRHILLIYPFLFVMAGFLVPWMAQQRAAVKALFSALALWYVASSVTIFPHYLAYFNELAGGPDNGYKYLVDSNLDWGQDLKGLKRYMMDHGIDRIWLSYFGLASPDYYGITYDYLPSLVIFDPKNKHRELLQLDRLPSLKGTVAISATNLVGVYLPVLGINKDYFEYYRNQTPVAKIGYSIFIYRVR